MGGIGVDLKMCSNPQNFPKTLIFCKTKSQCVRVFNVITKICGSRRMISMYHASLSEETKQSLRVQITNILDMRCLVCTIAFGMVSCSPYQRACNNNHALYYEQGN